ncbi:MULTISPECIES: M48 family metallopeptidase [unclassified Acinetobacter]|uniref:M48 family metallopeptidase n=1 Tax=unclassified Acinetobacter TaxID=196816 RepID=UPI0025758F80|nr:MULTISPECIES: M48 family metallopeptidase [unclassified Acinetobacter]MDM1763352.1 M48 family metallopeptidase [Acinetobacter sp. 226-1]MDM1766831.1 M48 family metallopeptidase [Acinetobacter sp. 226-4]
MMQSVQVIFYDGVVSKPHQAEVFAIDDEHIQVRYAEQTRNYSYADMQLIGALGQLKPVVELKDDARIEFQDHLPDWFQIAPKKIYGSIWKLERSPSLILFSVIFVVFFGFALVKWGIPSASHYIAFQLPKNSMQRLGDEAEKYVNEYWTEPTKLSKEQQEQIRQQYLKQIAEGQPAKLVFRKGTRLGANAIALPNNTILVTDELVELAHSDQEILGVLAHEQGHLIERHSLQQGLSSLGISILYIAITGDSSDLFSSLPTAMLGAKYSRKFEQEADLYALKLMDRQHIEVAHFANFLQRLSDEYEKEEGTATQQKDQKQKKNEQSEKDDQFSQVSEIFESHPATAKRIQMVRDFEKQQKKSP